MRLFILSLLLYLVIVWPAQAQPNVQRDFYDGQIVQRGASIVFCVWPDSPFAALDRAITEAVAQSQLIEAEIYDVPAGTAGTQEVFEQELFINLMDNCDVAMGGSYNWRPFPEWLTITAPYYSVKQALVVKDPAISRMDELPEGAKVGSILFSQADMDFARSLSSPSGSSVKRIPYDTAANILAGVASGMLDAGIVPSYAAHSLGVPVHVADTAPYTFSAEAYGMVLQSRNTYLRGLIDEALTSLQADGSLDAIALELGFP